MSKPQDYNKTASVYNQRYRETQFEKFRIMLIGLKLNGKILDHGCGTGLLSEFLSRKDLIGVDSSEEMLKLRGSGELADIEKLPYENQTFDFILSFSVMMNCKHPEKAIKEVQRVLKPSGTFICTFLKYFKPKIKPLLGEYFKIKEERECGEDIGFLLTL